MTTTLSPTRGDDLPKPGWEIVRKEAENKREDGSEMHTWLVKLSKKHKIMLLPEGSGRPRYGESEYVLVTTRWEVLGEHGEFASTTVYASDEDGKFYNAPLYITPGIREVWEALYAIGEN